MSASTDLRPPAVAGHMNRAGFWIGTCLVLAGVALHVPDYVSARDDGFRMVGMDMGLSMTVGMVLIAIGLAVAIRSMLPRGLTRTHLATSAERFAALDNAPLTRAHRLLATVLTIGLVVDTMKPASLGFVVPGMAKEYGITGSRAAMLPFVALVGTFIGSILWGYLADIVGRRATILLSALIYIATSICGFMPSLEWNLVMCFCMGASAGGMLPTVYALMSESIPARRRGWLLVVQCGLGTTLGYLVASGAAALLIPHFSWRALWLLGAPTGLLLLVLSRWIPESPRYLLATGRIAEADRVMARYNIIARASEDAADVPSESVLPGVSRPRPWVLLAPLYRRRTLAVVLYGLGWGVVNWGFITFLPLFLTRAGYGTQANKLLFMSALLAVPNILLAATLYARWSSRRSMLVYAGCTVAALVSFAVLRPDRSATYWLLVLILTVLLASCGGMIAMLSPYTTEIYPTPLRATGSGLAAAATKAAGMLGPLLVVAPSSGVLAIIGAVPVAIAAIFLSRTGLETAGRPLVEIHATQPAEARP
jgi:putative MFS transporter